MRLALKKRSVRNQTRRRHYGGRRESRGAADVPPLPNRLRGLRERVWGAMGIVSCVQYASDSMLEPTEEKPDIQSAMVALFNILSEISGALEDIGEELGGTSETEE